MSSNCCVPIATAPAPPALDTATLAPMTPPAGALSGQIDVGAVTIARSPGPAVYAGVLQLSSSCGPSAKLVETLAASMWRVATTPAAPGAPGAPSAPAGPCGPAGP